MTAILLEAEAGHSRFIHRNFEIPATQENLRLAIKEKGRDILQFEFIASSENYAFSPLRTSYSPVEFAVKIRDIDSLRALIRLGANATISKYSSFGTMMHFYIECIEENVTSDLEILKLLLQEVTVVEGSLLEHALKHMSGYKYIDWDVIELLLQKGVSISNGSHTPWMTLRDSQQHRVIYGRMVRQVDEEERFLNRLMTYLKLEKKYHPQLNSALTSEEFRLHTSNFWEMVSKATYLMQEASPAMQGRLGLAGLDVSHSTSSSIMTQLRTSYQQAQCQLVCQAISKYFSYFTELVREGNFKDCFDPRQLQTLLSIMRKHSSLFQPQLDLFKSWGLIDS